MHRDKIIADLTALARSVSDAEMAHISKADYGDQVEAHFVALKQVIFEQNCILHRHQYWHPSEVIELI